MYSGYEVWRLRLFSCGGYGLALVLSGVYDSYPIPSGAEVNTENLRGRNAQNRLQLSDTTARHQHSKFESVRVSEIQ